MATATANSNTLATPTAASIATSSTSAAPEVELGPMLEAIFRPVLQNGQKTITATGAAQLVSRLAQTNPSEFLVLERMLDNAGLLGSPGQPSSGDVGTDQTSVVGSANAFGDLIEQIATGKFGTGSKGGSAFTVSEVLASGGANKQPDQQAGVKPVDVTGSSVAVTPTDASTIQSEVGSDLAGINGMNLTPGQAGQAVQAVQGSQQAHAEAEQQDDNLKAHQKFVQDVSNQQASIQQKTPLFLKDQIPNPKITNPAQLAQAVLGYMGVHGNQTALEKLTAYITAAGGWGNGKKNPLNLKLQIGDATTDPKSNDASYTSWAQGIVAIASMLSSNQDALSELTSDKGADSESLVVGLNNVTHNRVSNKVFKQHLQLAQPFVGQTVKAQKATMLAASQKDTGGRTSVDNAAKDFTGTIPGGVGPALPGDNRPDLRGGGPAVNTVNNFMRTSQQSAAGGTMATGGPGESLMQPDTQTLGGSQPYRRVAGNGQPTGPVVQPNAQSMGGGLGAVGGASSLGAGLGAVGQGAVSGQQQQAGGPTLSKAQVAGGTPATMPNVYTPGNLTSLPPTLTTEGEAQDLALGQDRSETLGSRFLEAYNGIMDWVNGLAGNR